MYGIGRGYSLPALEMKIIHTEKEKRREDTRQKRHHERPTHRSAGILSQIGSRIGMLTRSQPWVDLDDVDRQAYKLLTDLGVSTHPVDPAQIAERLNYNVRAAAFGEADIAGQVSNLSGEVVIDVSGFDPPTRQRFTIAHEIGHAILHLQNGKHTDAFVDSSETLNRPNTTIPGRGVDRKELAANRFAAALLMPRTWVEEAVRGSLSLDDLAKRFGVSRSAMRHRLNSLGLLPET